ncbi:MAG TPA: hypothetical protein VF078_04130 [Nitrospira sp.]
MYRIRFSVTGVLPVSNVYNGWVQKLPTEFKNQLTAAQQNLVP